MIKFIKRNGTVFFNFSYLSILQILNLLVPLVTYPYLISIFREELYGYIAFSQLIAGYFTILISFGFLPIGTKEVSIHRNDTNKLSEIVSSICLAKSFFLILSFVICFGVVFVIDVPFKWLYVLSFWSCLNDVIFPIWFFQGIEQMKYITIISVISKLIVMLLIFVLIKSQADIYLYPLISLVGTIVSGVISFYIIYKKGIRLRLQSISVLYGYLKESYYFFISDVFTQIYTNTAKTITGVFLGMKEVAYYDLGEKIVSIFKMPQGILVQTLFSRVSVEKNPLYIKKVFYGSVTFSVAMYIGLFFSGEYIVSYLSKGTMLEAINIVRILGLAIICTVVSSVMGILVMIPFGYKKTFTKLIVFSSLMYIAFVALFYYVFTINLYTLCISVVLVELLIALFSFIFVYKNGIIWKKF